MEKKYLDVKIDFDTFFERSKTFFEKIDVNRTHARELILDSVKYTPYKDVKTVRKLLDQNLNGILVQGALIKNGIDVHRNIFSKTYREGEKRCLMHNSQFEI